MAEAKRDEERALVSWRELAKLPYDDFMQALTEDGSLLVYLPMVFTHLEAREADVERLREALRDMLARVESAMHPIVPGPMLQKKIDAARAALAASEKP